MEKDKIKNQPPKCLGDDNSSYFLPKVSLDFRLNSGYRTRTEHSRSIDDGPRLRAIDKLVEAGLLVRMSDLDIYHGRAGADNGWEVLENYSNGGNTNGNNNVHEISTLYTCGEEQAREFACKRARNAGEQMASMHKIVSSDMDALVVNGYFDYSSKSAEELSDIYHNLLALRIGATNGSPLSYNTINKDTAKKVTDRLNQLHQSFFGKSDISNIANITGVDEAIVHQIASSANSYAYFMRNPKRATLGLLSNVEYTHDGRQYIGLNNEYLASVFERNRIIGVMHSVYSATLRKNVSGVVSLFDLKRVKTEEQNNSENELNIRKYSVLSSFLSSELQQAKIKPDFKKIITNAYGKPRKLIKYVTECCGPELRAIFNADAGNWEGYTLAEHTLTVLENFDYNFADTLPVDLLPIMKTALLVHDIGKPVAVYHGQKHNQKKYNIHYAKKYLDKLGFAPKVKDFIIGMISEGAKLGEDIRIRHKEYQTTELRLFAQSELQKIIGSEGSVTEDMIKGYIDLIDVILTCDGGAYTDMAITVRNHATRNADSFNRSFEPPSDLPRRRIVFKGKRLAEL